MADTELSSKLYEKVSAEQGKFRAWLMGQPPADILDHAVECGAGHWDYHLYDEKFNETKSGELEVVGCSINEVRDMVLFENKLERRSMTPTDHGMLMEKAAMREQEAQAEKRESVLGQLSALKSGQKDKPSPAPEKKHREESR